MLISILLTNSSINVHKRFNPLNDRLIEYLLNRVQPHWENFHFHFREKGDDLCIHFRSSRPIEQIQGDAFIHFLFSLSAHIKIFPSSGTVCSQFTFQRGNHSCDNNSVNYLQSIAFGCNQIENFHWQPYKIDSECLNVFLLVSWNAYKFLYPTNAIINFTS
jgi:hypothetical protein